MLTSALADGARILLLNGGSPSVTELERELVCPLANLNVHSLWYDAATTLVSPTLLALDCEMVWVDSALIDQMPAILARFPKIPVVVVTGELANEVRGVLRDHLRQTPTHPAFEVFRSPNFGSELSPMNEPKSLEKRRRRQRLLESIAARRDESAANRIERYLQLGLGELGMTHALVSRLDDENMEILSCVSPIQELYNGLRVPASWTFCRTFLTSEEPIGVPDIRETPGVDVVAHTDFGLTSYLGCRISGNTLCQDTVCFCDNVPATKEFDLDDLAFIRDIARSVDFELRNQAQDVALRDQSALFEAIMRHSPSVAILKDTDGCYSFVSPLSQPEIHRWAQSVVGKRADDLFSAEVAATYDGSDQAILERGITLEGETRLDIPSVGERHLHYVKFPVELADGSRRVGIVAYDITHRVQAEANLANAYEATLEGWARTLDARDHETEGHSRRVANLAVRLANRLGYAEDQIVHLHRGALLHDIGKMGIPDSVLLKEGPLDDEQWKIMRQHPRIAAEMLGPINFLAPALDIPIYHHERWDGSGYPFGLVGRQIPWSARIFAVIDVYDALTSKRSYREAWPSERALEYIERHAGTQFDPAVVSEFLQMMNEEVSLGVTSARSVSDSISNDR